MNNNYFDQNLLGDIARFNYTAPNFAGNDFSKQTSYVNQNKAFDQMNAYKAGQLDASHMNFEEALNSYNEISSQILLLKALIDNFNSSSNDESVIKEKDISTLNSLISKLDNELKYLNHLRVF